MEAISSIIMPGHLNPDFSNNNDFRLQNHFIGVMSTQNNRRLTDELIEIMWFIIEGVSGKLRQ